MQNFNVRPGPTAHFEHGLAWALVGTAATAFVLLFTGAWVSIGIHEWRYNSGNKAFDKARELPAVNADVLTNLNAEANTFDAGPVQVRSDTEATGMSTLSGKIIVVTSRPIKTNSPGTFVGYEPGNWGMASEAMAESTEAVTRMGLIVWLPHPFAGRIMNADTRARMVEYIADLSEHGLDLMLAPEAGGYWLYKINNARRRDCTDESPCDWVFNPRTGRDYYYKDETRGEGWNEKEKT